MVVTKIYVPTDLLNKSCYQVNQGYIRVWDSVTLNESNTYTDVFINQDYQVVTDSIVLTESLKCDSANTYTDNVLYRVDIDRIFVIVFIFMLVCFLFPYRIFSRLFGKWLKL